MNIILLERVAKLGQMGDVVTVKDGYARNFLLPQKKAMRATKANKEFFEARRAQLEAENLERRNEAQAVADKMTDLKVIMIRAAGESGQLYGSVSSRDMAEAVTDAGVSITRSQVILDRAIKTLGLHTVTVKLHAEVSVDVVVNIARSDEEAETQFETGSAVVAQDELEGINELELGGALLDEDEELEIEDAADEVADEASEEE